jgi:hypothetical protein
MDEESSGLSEARENSFWAQLALQLLHPTQVEMIEALRWIGLPVSPSLLATVLIGNVVPPDIKHGKVSSVAYHTRRLVDLGIFRRHSSRPIRGAVETFYIFTPQVTPPGMSNKTLDDIIEQLALAHGFQFNREEDHFSLIDKLRRAANHRRVPTWLRNEARLAADRLATPNPRR